MAKKTRLTSRLAYQALVKSGALKGKQAIIMKELVNSPEPATSGEILYDLNVRNVNAWRGRFTELKARGLIREAGTRKCTVTGRRCITWEATGSTQPNGDRGAEQAGRSEARGWRKFALWMLEQHRDQMGVLQSVTDLEAEAKRRGLEVA